MTGLKRGALEINHPFTKFTREYLETQGDSSEE